MRPADLKLAIAGVLVGILAGFWNGDLELICIALAVGWTVNGLINQWVDNMKDKWDVFDDDHRSPGL